MVSLITTLDTSLVTDAFKEALNVTLTSTIGIVIAKLGRDTDKNWMTANELTDEIIERQGLAKLKPSQNDMLYVRQQVSSRLITMVNNETVARIGKSGGSFKYTCFTQDKRQKKNALIAAGFDPEDLTKPLEGIKRLMKKLDLSQFPELQMDIAAEMSTKLALFDETKQRLFELEQREQKLRTTFEALKGLYIEDDKKETPEPEGKQE